MTAALMLYGLIVGTFIALAACGAESVARHLARPTRWIWTAALLATVGLTAVAPVRSAASAGAGLASENVSPMAQPVALVLSAASGSVRHATASVLALVWLVMSAGVFSFIVIVHHRSHRSRARWPIATIAGTSVRVAPDDGPAAVGSIRPDIVVPRWLLERGEPEQQIVIAHEAQHVRSRDPLLLTAAWLLAAAMPWNPAIWWILSRLRLAVELDCDSRVLASGTTRSSYGQLLIDVAAVQAGTTLPATALLDPPSHLERRLIAMNRDNVRFVAARALAAGCVVAVGILVACEAKMPTSGDIDRMDAASAERLARATRTVTDSVTFTVDGQQVSPAVAKAVPADQIASVETVAGKNGTHGSRINVLTIRGRQGRDTGYAITSVPAGRDTSYRVREDAPAVAAALSEAAGRDAGVGRGGRQGGASQGVRREIVPDGDAFKGIVIIDGKRASLSQLRDLDRSTIDHVEILKGRAAAQTSTDPAAAYGIITVTTKR